MFRLCRNRSCQLGPRRRVPALVKTESDGRHPCGVRPKSPGVRPKFMGSGLFAEERTAMIRPDPSGLTPRIRDFGQTPLRPGENSAPIAASPAPLSLQLLKKVVPKFRKHERVARAGSDVPKLNSETPEPRNNLSAASLVLHLRRSAAP